MNRAQAKEILKMAWPLIIANSFWNLQLTIDRIFLGAHSTEALGAAMTVMGVFWVPMALLQQTAAYVTTFIAQYQGAKEPQKMGAAVWQAIYVCVIGGVLFLLQNLLSRYFFSFVGHAPLIQELEVEYFNSVAYSALPAALIAVVSGFYTGLGNTQMVIWLNFVGLIGNAVFDYLLIFGHWGFPKLGVSGAGYATAIGNYMAVVLGAWLLFHREHELKYRMFSSWRFDPALMKQFLKYGLPSGMQWALEGLAFTVFLIIMGRLSNGEAALASSSIAVTVMMLSVLPSMGVAQAVMTLVGQNLGENNPGRAEKAALTGVKISAVYMACTALTFVFIPHLYLKLFENSENLSLWSQVSTITPTLLKIVACFTITDSIYLNLSFALKGAGDTRIVSLLALVVPWPVMVLPAYLVAGWENAVIWAWTFVILYSFTITGLVFLRFKQGRWKAMRVV